MPARVLKELCQGCGICTQVCPVGAVSLNGGYAAVEAGKCEKDCEECIFACPNGAITMKSREFSPEFVPANSDCPVDRLPSTDD
ncbi:MAG: 4Fe-4S binding protein [Desulfotomaculales bacterium]